MWCVLLLLCTLGMLRSGWWGKGSLEMRSKKTKGPGKGQTKHLKRQAKYNPKL